MLRWIVLVGVALRLLLLPFTMQADARFVGDLVAMHVDARGFVAGTMQDAPLYPPLAYITLDAWQRVVALIVPDVRQLQKDTPSAWASWFEHPQRFAMLFWLKLWVLPFDLLCGVLLLRLTPPPGRPFVALGWFLNPVLIYTTAVHGQFDAVPAFFCVLALLAFQRGGANRALWAGALLGLGAAFKLYPLLLLPPLLLALGRHERLPALAACVIPVALPLIGQVPRYLSAHPFYDTALFSIALPMGVPLPIYALLYLALLLVLWRRILPRLPLERAWLLLLLLFYLQAAFDLHYLTWAMPFALLLAWRWPRTRWPWLLFGVCALLLYLPTWGNFLLPLGVQATALNVLLPVWVVRTAQVGVWLAWAWLAWLLLRASDATQ